MPDYNLEDILANVQTTHNTTSVDHMHLDVLERQTWNYTIQPAPKITSTIVGEMDIAHVHVPDLLPPTDVTSVEPL